MKPLFKVDSYIELKVPIDYEASWFSKLRSMMKDIPVVWQKGYYHITMAFIDETPKGVDLCPSLEKHLRNAHVLLSPFQLTLTDVDYREFRGRTLYIKKLQTSAYETYT